MTIKQDGKNIVNAKIIYNSFGTPELVVKDGVNYDAKAFEITDDEPVKKTKDSPKTEQIMTTKDVKSKAK